MTLHEEKGLAGGSFSIGHESIAFHRLGQPLLDDVKASRMTFGHTFAYFCILLHTVAILFYFIYSIHFYTSFDMF